MIDNYALSVLDEMMQAWDGYAQPSWLEHCLAPLPHVRAAVFGDFCLDAYWILDTEGVELSIETGLPVRRVRGQRYSLGGAGNVAANLIDLGVGAVQAIGVLGTDLFGYELMRLLDERGIDGASSMVREEQWQTMVYVKPYFGDKEESRIDCGDFNVLRKETIDTLIAALDQSASENDVVILNQQVPNGISNFEVIKRINEVIADHPSTVFVADARHHPDLYRGAVLKLNADEAAQFMGVSGEDHIFAARASELTRQISHKTKKSVFLTRGDRGIVVASDEAAHEISGIQIIGKTDPVGAGDTVLAALSAVLGSGQHPFVAGRLANIAAAIAVQKIQTTGSATPEEILSVGPWPDYIYEPELADSPHLAHYLPGTEIEQIGNIPENLQIQHCIFDHDGTLSTLREGWEKLMEPMMLQAVLGPEHASADAALYGKTRQEVRSLIDRTTGTQTLMQMKALVDLVKQSGFVPQSEALDEHGYKHLFNEALVEMVDARMAKLKAGELDSTDFQIKNAALLLRQLHDRGVKLYLASGTDQADVLAEATALGYADLFEGRIFGAVGDTKIEAKKVVLDKIIREHNLQGHQLATFGDGPMEITEGRKRRGFCVGVACDEIRRFGLNAAKRSRLIRAGATLVVPDYSQLPALLKALHFS